MGPSRETVTLHEPRAVPIAAGTSLMCQPRGRKCQVPDCHTVLSRYNPSETCARHAGWQDAPTRRRTD